MCPHAHGIYVEAHYSLGKEGPNSPTRLKWASGDANKQWLKWFCEAGGGAHLMKPGWSKPHTHTNPTNLALFRHKITLYRFYQGAHTIAVGAQIGAGGEPPSL